MRTLPLVTLASRRACRVLAATVILWLAVLPMLAEEGVETTLGEIQKMLEATLSEPIILQWLETHHEIPERPNAEQLIALKTAGASDKLLARVLELSKTRATQRTPIAVVDPATPVIETELSGNPTPARFPPPSPEGPRDATTASDGTVPVHFEMTYLPNFDEDEDEWLLYAYIDGEPLTYVPAGSVLGTKRLRFRHYLAPGKHVLRVTQERHEKRWGDRWFHAARIAAPTFSFDVAAGSAAEVELKFRQSSFPFSASEGPLSFRFIQGKNVVVQDNVGGDPEDWRLLCEEIESNAEAGKLKRSLRRQLEGCLQWADLWSDPDTPDRREIRQALALFRYRPIPKDQPLN